MPCRVSALTVRRAGQSGNSDHVADGVNVRDRRLKPIVDFQLTATVWRQAELFETESFINLVKTLRNNFDITVIDTPPLGVFPDAMLISRICDEAMYVCRFNAVNRSKIRKTLERLKQTSAVFSGIVLNGLPTGAQSAYYDYYGYGSNESKRYKVYYAQKR